MSAAGDGSGARAMPESAYARMAFVLQIGLGAAVAIFVVGLAAYLALHPGARWSANAPNLARAYLSVRGLADGLAAGNPVAVLTVGILALVATPIVRVLSGLYYFERHGERTMAWIAFVVFLGLLVGLFLVGPLVR